MLNSAEHEILNANKKYQENSFFQALMSLFSCSVELSMQKVL